MNLSRLLNTKTETISAPRGGGGNSKSGGKEEVVLEKVDRAAGYREGKKSENPGRTRGTSGGSKSKSGESGRSRMGRQRGRACLTKFKKKKEGELKIFNWTKRSDSWARKEREFSNK